MSNSVNKVIVVGNLGADPEIGTLPQGGRVANLRVVTTAVGKDRDTGKSEERAEWHNVAVFSENLVSLAEGALRKGSKVYLEGHLRTRKWQGRHGEDQCTTEIVLEGPMETLIVLERPAEVKASADDSLPAVKDGRDQPIASHHHDLADDLDDDNIPF